MRREQGFSLVELMVALVMTLIVSGAIYGLMASGQGSFKREPALVDRQQNIRVAMDLIARDLENAGAGMTGWVDSGAIPFPGLPPLVQIFSRGLDNIGPIPSAIFAGQNADALEFVEADGSCPAVQACPESVGSDIYLYEPTTVAPRPASDTCLDGTLFAFLTGPGSPTSVAPNLRPGGANAPAGFAGGLLFLTRGADVAQQCEAAAGARTHFSVPAAMNWINPAAAASCPAGRCRSLTKVSLIRYELAGENPALPATFGPGTPNPTCLWRSEYGRYNIDGTVNAGPNLITPVANNPWQMVARGIDDLQVEYQAGPTPAGISGGFAVLPPLAAGGPGAANTDTVVRKVRITLSARAIGTNLGGETRYTTNAAGEIGRRGQMTTTVSPRAALRTVAMDTDSTKNWR